MKRIGVLLMVLVALAWAGSKLVSHGDPLPAAAQRVASEARADQASLSAAPPAEIDGTASAAEKKVQQEKWFGAETIVAAQRAVRDEMKDPASAEFKEVRANYSEGFGLVACGQVNARNDLGGYTGFRRFVSNGKSVILEGRDNIADAWAGACS